MLFLVSSFPAFLLNWIRMDTQSDDWIEHRMRWAFGKHELTPAQAHFIPDLLADCPAEAIEAASSGRVGRAVVAFSRGDERWTLVGTRAVISHFDGQDVRVDLAELATIDVADRNLKKTEHEHLALTDRDGRQHVIWLPRGGAFFAVWGVLKRFIPRTA